MASKWLMISVAGVALLLNAAIPSFSQDKQQISDQVYVELDYLSSLFGSEKELDSSLLVSLIEFVNTIQEDTSLDLRKRNNMEGVLHVFQINSSFQELLGYVYNPDIPPYITKPSSLQSQHMLTPEFVAELRHLTNGAEAVPSTVVLRGEEHETITPDTNTGSYYTYTQDKLFALLPGALSPILVSASRQDEISDVGRRGCIVGSYGNWDYLYSEKTGLNTLGLGWVRSYMYGAYSVMLSIPNPETGTIKTAVFKWLNAGWQKINMVKSSHILGGIKRFAAAMKSVLESPALPEVQEIVDKHKELQRKDEEELRRLVAPYLESIGSAEDAGSCPSYMISSVASGEYLQKMENEEIIRILLLEYIKTHIDNRVPETAAALALGTSAG
ncbi:MAG: hypothetical protein KJO28_00980 [Desulfofustis sp.]|nr:hypothetical protein [Desulfofustis sp.]